MSETGPKFETTAEHLIDAGGQHEISAHTERAPTPAEVASEKLHMIQEVEPIIAEHAPSKDVVSDYQMQQAALEAPAPVRESRKVVGARELSRVQRQLPARDRTLSRVIHQPVVRAVSEAAAGTISRPSGLLGGGIVAFIGSAAYLYFTHHVGVPYNYVVFSLLFVGGFAFGLVLELIVWTLTASRRHTE